MRLSVLVSVVLLVAECLCGSPDEWKQRTIYQVLTDRISPSGNPSGGCSNLGDYCGGTFKGIQQNIPYIQKMGFDAIWISPVITNTPGGYHGYWAQDIYTINSNFGTEQDLMDLVTECHNNGIWVMLDVVGNHMGPVDYSQLIPFNQASYFHDCSQCPSNCDIADFTDLSQMQLCRLAGLPDLNQSNPDVANTLTSWITNITQHYGFDGLRVDTVPEVSPDFWTSFQQAAGVYAVGEVYDARVSFVAGYQGPLTATLSYPMFFTLRNVFESQQSMYNIRSTWQQYTQSFSDVDLLGTFIDNHDQPRFLNGNSDYKLYQNAITYVLMAQGVPIIYYGTEQGFSGGNDPDNREPLWPTGFGTDNSLFAIISTVVSARKQVKIWSSPQVERYADDSFYAFSRGDTLVLLTNGGSKAGQITRTITYLPYSNGQKLCNIFYPSADCITVSNNSLQVYLDSGESKVYLPA